MTHRIENDEARNERRAAEWHRSITFTSAPLNQRYVADLARRPARPASPAPARRSVTPPEPQPENPLASLYWWRS